MNHIAQNILVIAALVLALLFLVNKFFWKKTSKSKKSCGSDDGCGCH